MTEQAQGKELGQKLLNAVERIVDGDLEIQAVVERYRFPEELGLDAHAERVIAHYSNRSAWTGGATALPGVIPGMGTLAVLVAAPLTDMVLLLKFETELCLALSAVHGHDIADPAERQMAFLLAALKTAALHPDRSALCDGLEITAASVTHYAPRRLSKLLVTVMASLAAVAASKSLVRAVPLIGVAVGAGMNKVLTRRLGRQVHEELHLRRRLTRAPV